MSIYEPKDILRKTIIFLLFLIILSFLSSVKAGEAIIRKKGTLTLTILDKRTSKGIPNANITIYSGDGSIVLEGNTDEDGFFYTQLDAGTYMLEVCKRGYESKTLSFSINWGESKFLYIKLEYAIMLDVNTRYIVATAGSTVNIPLRISNQGSYTEECLLEVEGIESWNWSFNFGQIIVRKVALDPGDNINLSLIIKIPYYAEGIYNLTVLVKSTIPIYIPIVVKVKPMERHFIISEVKSLKVLAGEQITLPGVILSNPLDDDFYASLAIKAPKEWHASIFYQNLEIKTLYLKAGGQYQLKFIIEVPEEAKEGNYTIYINVLDEENKITVDVLKLSIEVMRKEPEIVLYADTPHINAYIGSRATYRVRIANEGTAETMISLSIQGLPSTFTYTIEDEMGNKISGLYMKPNVERTLIIRVNIPSITDITTTEFAFVVSYLNQTITLPLSLSIIGEKKVEILTENFLVRAYLGEDKEFLLKVRNNGTVTLNDLRILLTEIPGDFNITVSPQTLSLAPGKEGVFTMMISIPGDIPAGDYYVSFRIISSEYIGPEYLLRIEVEQSISYTMLGAAVVIVMTIVLLIAYKRYGRR